MPSLLRSRPHSEQLEFLVYGNVGQDEADVLSCVFMLLYARRLNIRKRQLDHTSHHTSLLLIDQSLTQVTGQAGRVRERIFKYQLNTC